MYDYDEVFSKRRFDKKTKLITYAHFEIRALKSTFTPTEKKGLKNYLYKDFDSCRNIYGFITGSEISGRTSDLISECAPLIYPYRGLKTIAHSIEHYRRGSWIGHLNDNNGYTLSRVYFTALELLFMRASFEELLAIIAFMVDDTRKLVKFEFNTWVYREIEFVKNQVLLWERFGMYK